MENMTNYVDRGGEVLEGHCETYYARKKGKSHVDNGTVCQDYCLVEKISNDIQIVCVADGHGGEAYTKSDKGSKYACTIFVESIKTIVGNYEKSEKEHNWINVLRTPDFKKAYIQRWKQAVVEDYKKEDENTKESNQSIIKKYGTTFLFTIYAGNRYVVGQLGDGAILMSNEYGQSQLFKRHGIKTSSATSSLASNRAEYAFVIDVFETEFFSRVLLSTDGIYDKLDNDDSFSLYERDLVEQIQKEGELKRPFDVQGIDVSEITKDDCTIALIKSVKETKPLLISELENEGFKKIKFYRYVSGIAIFEGEWNGKRVEIHMVDSAIGEVSEDIDMKSAVLKKAEKIIKVDQEKLVFVYSIPDDYHRVAGLVDSGEHLEKKYWFHDHEVNTEDETTTVGTFSNEYWLKFYEQVMELEDELQVINISASDYFSECLFVTNDNTIIVLSDALIKCKDVADNASIRNLLSRFSIVGKLSCGKISIPLFGTNSQGQSIIMLHASTERKVLCKVIYNPEKKILGLWNVTDSAWNLENEKRKAIPAQGVMRLNKDHIFYVQPDEMAKNDDAEFLDGYAKYQVKVLRR